MILIGSSLKDLCFNSLKASKLFIWSSCFPTRRSRRGSAAASPCQKTRHQSPRRSPTTSGPECAASQVAEQQLVDAWTQTTWSCCVTTTAASNSGPPPTDERRAEGGGSAYSSSPLRSSSLALTSRTSKQNKIYIYIMGSCCLIFKHQSNTFTVFSEHYEDSLSPHLFLSQQKI